MSKFHAYNMEKINSSSLDIWLIFSTNIEIILFIAYALFLIVMLF